MRIYKNVEDLKWFSQDKLKNYRGKRIIRMSSNFTHFDIYKVFIEKTEVKLKNRGTAFLHDDERFLSITNRLVNTLTNCSLNLSEKNIPFMNFFHGFCEGYYMRKKEEKKKAINQPKEK